MELAIRNPKARVNAILPAPAVPPFVGSDFVTGGCLPVDDGCAVCAPGVPHMSGPELVLLVVATYALVGLAFGLAFVTVGVPRFDPAARETSWAFRALILPGSAALWPLLAARWARRKGEST